MTNSIPVKIRGFASRPRDFSSRVNEDENEISRIPLPRQKQTRGIKISRFVFSSRDFKTSSFFCEEIDPRATISSPRFARGFKTS